MTVANEWNVGTVVVNEAQIRIALMNGLTRTVVASRISEGQTVEKAIKSPIREHNNNKYTQEDIKTAAANGILYQTFMNRIYRGWDAEKARTKPTAKKKVKVVEEVLPLIEDAKEAPQHEETVVTVDEERSIEMSKFEEYLLKEKQDAYLIEDGTQAGKTKDDYIVDAEEGVIVAFRLNFVARSGTKLTKVISGKILENNKEEEIYVIETRNNLKYGVPYSAVSWVKTGSRWPKGVYEEMKRGATEVPDGEVVFGELGEIKIIDVDVPNDDNSDDDFKI